MKIKLKYSRIINAKNRRIRFKNIGNEQKLQ